MDAKEFENRVNGEEPDRHGISYEELRALLVPEKTPWWSWAIPVAVAIAMGVPLVAMLIYSWRNF